MDIQSSSHIFFYWDADKVVNGHGGGGHSGKSWLSNDKSHNFELFLISCPYDIILGPHLLFKCA